MCKIQGAGRFNYDTRETIKLFSTMNIDNKAYKPYNVSEMNSARLLLTMLVMSRHFR